MLRAALIYSSEDRNEKDSLTAGPFRALVQSEIRLSRSTWQTRIYSFVNPKILLKRLRLIRFVLAKMTLKIGCLFGRINENKICMNHDLNKMSLQILDEK